MLRQLLTVAHPLPFQMVSTCTQKGETGLTPVVSLSKDGGPFQSALGQVIEIGRGWYALLGHQQDRNTLGSLILDATVGDPDVVCVDAPAFEIVGYDPYSQASQSPLVNVTDSSVAAKLDTTNQLLQRLATAERA